MKEQNNNREKWLHLRLTTAEYEHLQKLFTQSTSRKLSQYARHVLLQKPVTVKYRNQSLDDFMTETIKLRTELNGIGNNFNQAVKKLHTLHQIPEFRQWLSGWELGNQAIQNKIDEIKTIIQKLAEQWLQ